MILLHVNSVALTPLLMLSQTLSEPVSNALSNPSAAVLCTQRSSVATNVHLDRESADEDGGQEGGVPLQEGAGWMLAVGSRASGCPRKLACRERRRAAIETSVECPRGIVEVERALTPDIVNVREWRRADGWAVVVALGWYRG